MTRNNLLAATVDADGYAVSVQITEEAMKRWDAPGIAARLFAVNRVAYLSSQAAKRDKWVAAGVRDIDPTLPTWDDVSTAQNLIPD